MTANNHPAGDYSSGDVIEELEAFVFPAEEAVMQIESGATTQ